MSGSPLEERLRAEAAQWTEESDHHKFLMLAATEIERMREERDALMDACDLGVAHILGQHDYPAPTKKEVVDEMLAAMNRASDIVAWHGVLKEKQE
jgi:hypothetical protein